MQYQAGSGGRAVSLDWRKHRELDELAAQPGWRGALFKWLDLLLGAGRLLAFLLGAAMLFAVVGTAILTLVGLTYREADAPEMPPPRSVRTRKGD